MRAMAVLPLMVALLVPLAASADTLTITVSGVRSDKGTVRAAVYDNEANFPDATKARLGGLATAKPGEVKIVIENLPPGRYAVAAFHDENGNGKLDRNAMNIPTEGYGFSNDARGTFGPPKFGAASFSFDAQHAAITLALDY